MRSWSKSFAESAEKRKWKRRLALERDARAERIMLSEGRHARGFVTLPIGERLLIGE